jgi:hypothetical protein
MEHGTLLNWQAGCRCEDCVYAHKFECLQQQQTERFGIVERRFKTPKKSRTRRFPARDLVMYLQTPNASTVADLIGSSRVTVTKWLRDGTCFNVYQADEYACRAGVHPTMIWGEDWYAED